MKNNKNSHPLFGANMRTLWNMWRQSGGVSPDRRRQLFGMFLSAAGRLPFSLAEKAYVAARQIDTANAPAPIFILGHWRSGTTHLYNVMTKADQFGYVSPFATALPWNFLLLGKALAPLLEKQLPEHRYIDRVPVERDSPQEDEIALANMTSLSFYHALYFPRRFREYFNAGIFFEGVPEVDIQSWCETLRYFYAKLTLEHGSRPLLIKNPVYTARVALLRRIWPDAKFIHIHRNPYKVFVSMRNFYQRLFTQFALQSWDHIDIDGVILSTYERMMGQLAVDTAALPENCYTELSFGAFQEHPLEEIEKIYAALGLEGFEAAEPAFGHYLDQVRNYRKNDYRLSDRVTETVSRRWAPFINRWGYSIPE